MWIDALSINQKSSPDALREREHQIQLMKHIYSMAEQVIVWMGVPDDTTARFIKEYLTEQKSLINGLVNTTAEAIWTTLLQRFSWWRRMWILQEVALASNVWVHYGILSVSFDRLISELAILHEVLQKFFERNNNSIRLQLLKHSMSSGYAPPPLTFYDLRKHGNYQAAKYRTGPQPWRALGSTDSDVPKTHAFQEFGRYIVRFRRQETSEPLDKLYGLLGLVPDIVGHELDPRYDEDVVRMYRRTAAHIIRSSKSLYILSQAQIDLEMAPYAPMLPSWVPDWAATIPITLDWDNALFREYREKLFDASSGAPCEVHTCDDDCVLILKGVMIDTISDSRGLPLPTENFQQWWQRTYECRELAGVHDFQESADDLYIDGRSLNRAYLRTLLHNTVSYTSSWDNPERSYSLSYEDSSSHLENGLGRECLLCIDDIDDVFLTSILKLAQAEKEGATVTLDPTRLFGHLQRVNQSRIFFVTTYGFMGTGTMKLRPGDQIWVLAGGSHAFILREETSTPGHHILVGEAYVEGVMMPGDLKKPYVAQCIRRRRHVGDEEIHANGGEVMWEEVYLR